MGVESGMSRVSIVNGLHSCQGALIAGLMMRSLCARLDVPFLSFDEVLRDPSWMDRIRCFDEQLSPKIPRSLSEVISGPPVDWLSEERRLILTSAGRELLDVSEAQIDETSWKLIGLMVNQEHLAKNQWSPVHGDYFVHVTNTSVLSNLSDLCGITDTVMWTEDLKLLSKHALVEMSMDNIDEVVNQVGDSTSSIG